ncbi:hypothetical protein ACFQ3C_04970 [Seohaeicola saemankumensis]|uniref:Uncharacterized protein n=1 Tax=Seohaeicola saemankumensis TaxID=481181 RepID=A0ABW3TA56_9RHOB
MQIKIFPDAVVLLAGRGCLRRGYLRQEETDGAVTGEGRGGWGGGADAMGCRAAWFVLRLSPSGARANA